MSKETKSVSVELTKLESTVSKMKKDGWEVAGYDFSSKGPAYTVLKMQRDKPKKKGK